MRVSSADYPYSGQAWLQRVQATLQFDPSTWRPAAGDGADSYQVAGCSWTVNGDGTADINVGVGGLPGICHFRHSSTPLPCCCNDIG